MSQFTVIKDALQQLKPELAKRFHVSSIGLFGSIVRSDFSLSSDVDIIVDFTKPVGIEFIELADFIEEKLNKNIDLVSRKGIKQSYLKVIEPEIVYV